MCGDGDPDKISRSTSDKRQDRQSGLDWIRSQPKASMHGERQGPGETRMKTRERAVGAVGRRMGRGGGVWWARIVLLQGTVQIFTPKALESRSASRVSGWLGFWEKTQKRLVVGCRHAGRLALQAV